MLVGGGSLRPGALHGQRAALNGHVCAPLRVRARRDVATVDGTAVDYFVSAGALFGRFVHACGLVAWALDVPGASAGRGHYGCAGNAAYEGQAGEQKAHSPSLTGNGDSCKTAQRFSQERTVQR